MELKLDTKRESPLDSKRESKTENRFRDIKLSPNPEFPTLERRVNEDEMEEISNPTESLPKEKALALFPYFLFLAFLGILYIGNRHNSDAKIRKWTYESKKIQELKWEYLELESKWLPATQQSQIFQSASPLGLIEPNTPPYIIRIEK